MREWERSILWDGIFQGRGVDADFAQRVYRQHIKEVCAHGITQPTNHQTIIV